MHGGWIPIAILQQMNGMSGRNLVGVGCDKKITVLYACCAKEISHGYSVMLFVVERVPVRNLWTARNIGVEKLRVNELEAAVLLVCEVERFRFSCECSVRF